jgi:hypothetical protein
MPPHSTWFAGREPIIKFSAARVTAPGQVRIVRTRANGQPALATCQRAASGDHRERGRTRQGLMARRCRRCLVSRKSLSAGPWSPSSARQPEAHLKGVHRHQRSGGRARQPRITYRASGFCSASKARPSSAGCGHAARPSLPCVFTLSNAIRRGPSGGQSPQQNTTSRDEAGFPRVQGLHRTVGEFPAHSPGSHYL